MTTPTYYHIDHLCEPVLIEPFTSSSGSLRLTLHCFVLGARGVWVAQPTTGEKPPPLSGHTFTKIDHKRAVAFGGSTGSRVNDTYVLDMETWVWMFMHLSLSVTPMLCFYCLS